MLHSYEHTSLDNMKISTLCDMLIKVNLLLLSDGNAFRQRPESQSLLL